MPLTPYLAKTLLDFVTGAAAVTQPASRWIQLCSGSPTSVSDSAAPVASRLSWQAAAANSPDGSATNLIAFQASATATAACTLRGWVLYDRSSGGTRLVYGTFASSVTCASGDFARLVAGAMKITVA